METYITHNNGGKAFCVKINNLHKLTIYAVIDNNELVLKKLKTVNCKKIFIGKSYLHKITDAPDEYPGNSLLVQIDELKYMYIGVDVFTFKTKSEIQEYHSLVGNNDVVYAFAVDSNNNSYIMNEQIMLTPDLYNHSADNTPFDNYDIIDKYAETNQFDSTCLYNIEQVEYLRSIYSRIKKHKTITSILFPK